MSAARCRTPAPESAAGYAAAFNSLSGGWAGGDQASSTLLPDGRVLWLFGDTLQGTWAAEGGLIGAHMVHNSFVLQDAGCFLAVNSRDGGEVIPSDAGEWYWPQQALAEGTRVWVTAMRVAGGAPNDLTFSIRGIDLVEFAIRPGGVPEFVRIHPTPATNAGDFGVLWGTGLAQDSGTVYLFGTRRTYRPLLGKELLLATAPFARLSDPGAWRYRTATGWSHDPASAAVLYPAEGGVSTALSAHRTSGGWVLVTKQDEFMGTDVIALLARDPWGPFEIRTLFTAPSEGDRIAYLPLAHPELPLQDGSLLVTVSHNNTSLAVVLHERNAFRPTFSSVAGLG